MYDVDMFDTPAPLVRAMHGRGIKAVCYISAGSWEDWRPDADEFPESVLGNLRMAGGAAGSTSGGWPALGPIMRARIAMCADKGFDGVEFDNVDGYQNDTGFPLTGADQSATTCGSRTRPTAAA